jgi:hypothetical protein
MFCNEMERSRDPLTFIIDQDFLSGTSKISGPTGPAAFFRTFTGLFSKKWCRFEILKWCFSVPPGLYKTY